MYRPSKIDHVACKNIKDNNILYRLLKHWDQYIGPQISPYINHNIDTPTKFRNCKDTYNFFLKGTVL